MEWNRSGKDVGGENPYASPKGKEEEPARPRFVVSIAEVYIAQAIIGLLFGFLYPAVEQARQMQGRPPALPFDVTQWDRGTTLLTIAAIALLGPLPFCGILVLIRRVLPERWKSRIVWWHERRKEPARPMTRHDAGIFLGVMGGFCALIAFGLIYEKTVSDPWPIPGPPNERNRIEHPGGFSMVFPEGWKTIVVPANPERPMGIPNSLSAHPPREGARRIPHLSVGLCEERPLTDRFWSAQFQGRPAFELFDASGGGSTIWMEYYLVFERDGRWFEFSFQMPNSTALEYTRTETLPPEVKQYANTFRTEAEMNNQESSPRSK